MKTTLVLIAVFTVIAAALIFVIDEHNASQARQSTAVTAPAVQAAATTAVAAPVVSADQQLVDALNTIKAKYPADTTPKVSLASLPTFVRVACQIVSSGAAASAEWGDIATVLAQSKRCTP
jgi:hypothetical protein